MTIRSSRVMITAWLALAAVTGSASANAAMREPDKAKLQWWRDARFAMFIHWGSVSLKGTEIGWSRGAQIQGVRQP
ncbi:MAG: alpha-L-fucosidase [Thermoguttaceae bacterium]|jgi:alpha-L-fucosidase